MAFPQSQHLSAPFIISRVFDAPRDTVFKAWTDPKLMAEWWGPLGVTIIHSEMDFRPGGTYLYGMKTPVGTEMWGKFVYKDIKAPEEIVCINSFSDPQSGVTRHPLVPTWPLETHTIFTFKEVGGDKTEVTVEWAPYHPTDIERMTFDASHASMQQGWTGTLDQFAAYLARTKN